MTSFVSQLYISEFGIDSEVLFHSLTKDGSFWYEVYIPYGLEEQAALEGFAAAVDI